GDAQSLFGSAGYKVFVGFLADASDVLSGVGLRSKATRVQVRPVFDPRPPRLKEQPWPLIWSSRPNPQRRVRVMLAAPSATAGTMAGFRVWQAHETSVLDFALETAGSQADRFAVEKLIATMRQTTNMQLRKESLRQRIVPTLRDADVRTALLAKFDALSSATY